MSQPGGQLGPYTLLEWAGADAWGDIWVASAAESPALLWVHVRKAANLMPIHRERAIEALTLARRLKHPHIRSPLGFGVHPPTGALYWAAESNPLAHLGALADVQGAMEPRAVLLLLQPVISALQYAAEKGLHHGRLRPEWICLDSAGGVRVGGFGLLLPTDSSSPSPELSLDSAHARASSEAQDARAVARLAQYLLSDHGQPISPAQQETWPAGLAAWLGHAMQADSDATLQEAMGAVSAALESLGVADAGLVRSELLGELEFFFLLRRTFGESKFNDALTAVQDRSGSGVIVSPSGAAQSASGVLPPLELPGLTTAVAVLTKRAAIEAAQQLAPIDSEPTVDLSRSGGLPSLDLHLPGSSVGAERTAAAPLGRAWWGMFALVAVAVATFGVIKWTETPDGPRAMAAMSPSPSTREAPPASDLPAPELLAPELPAPGAPSRPASSAAPPVGGDPENQAESIRRGNETAASVLLVPPQVEDTAGGVIVEGANDAVGEATGEVAEEGRSGLEANAGVAWQAVFAGDLLAAEEQLERAERAGMAAQAPWVKLRVALARRSGDFDPARRWLEAALVADPKAVPLVLAAAAVRIESGHDEQALQLLSDFMLTEQGMESASAHYWLGRAHEALRQWDVAADAYKESLQRDPKMSAAAWGLIRVRHRRSKGKDAARELERRLDVAGERDQISLYLGEVALRERKLAEAARQFGVYVVARPRDWRGWFGLGVAQFRLHRLGEAIEAYARCLSLQPWPGPLEHNLALAHLRIGNEDRAEQIWLALHEADPTTWRASCELARLAHKRGQDDATVLWLQRTARSNPGHPWARSAAQAGPTSAKGRELLGRDCSVPDHYDSVGDLDVAGRFADGYDGYPTQVVNK